MTNSYLESVADFKKYLKKLKGLIVNNYVFSLFGKRLMHKNLVDDIFCCLEASWPEDYKAYMKRFKERNIKSPANYRNLVLAIKNRFLFSSNHYFVTFDKAMVAIDALYASIEKDMSYIYSDRSGMF